MILILFALQILINGEARGQGLAIGTGGVVIGLKCSKQTKPRSTSDTQQLYFVESCNNDQVFIPDADGKEHVFWLKDVQKKALADLKGIPMTLTEVK